MIPKPGRIIGGYDLILVSQPWRAGMPAQFKAQKILAPLVRNLAAARRLLTLQFAARNGAICVVQIEGERRAVRRRI